MLHSTALSEKTLGKGTLSPLHPYDRFWCEDELIHLHDGFWDDVNWGVYYCPTCDQVICCVEGGVHWWNFTSSNPRPENLERGRELAKNRNQ